MTASPDSTPAEDAAVPAASVPAASSPAASVPAASSPAASVPAASSPTVASSAARVPVSPVPAHPAQPVIGLVMGSDSDWNVMGAAADVLRDFAVPFEADVVSAHRTPHRMLEYAGAAAGRGLRVVIAGAGGAAHLPGMLAAATTLPVIGVPVPLRQLDGLDSLLSIVQMPRGVPVATVSIGGAANAALLAIRILATGRDDLAARLAPALADYAETLQATAAEGGARLRAHLSSR